MVRAEGYLERPEGVSQRDRTSMQLQSYYHSVQHAKGQIAYVSVDYSKIVILINTHEETR